MTSAGSAPGFEPRVTPERYLTEDVAPIGGVIKEREEDFLVEEIPLYEACGEGEHLYLFVEKRGLSTLHAVRLLAAHFQVRPDAIGYAGLKDKRAITRQAFSVHVPGRRESDFPMLRHERLGVLWAAMHTNKLRVGHLRGNRFSIRIRRVDPTGAVRAGQALERMARLGVPNRFGEQRFGNSQRNHQVGRALILGDHAEVVRLILGPDEAHPTVLAEPRRLFAAGEYARALEATPRTARTERQMLGTLMRGGRPRDAVGRMDPVEKGYFLSAFQSAVFNAVLDDRLRRGAMGTVEAGDVAFKHVNGATFEVTDEVAANPETQERARVMEISATGPMWGASMRRASLAVGEVELAALQSAGLSVADLEAHAARVKRAMEGARRPFRVAVTDPQVEGGVDAHGPYVRCAFDLPRGAFATSVMQEIMKPERAGAPDLCAPDPEPHDAETPEGRPHDLEDDS